MTTLTWALALGVGNGNRIRTISLGPWPSLPPSSPRRRIRSVGSCPAQPLPRTRLLPNLTADGFCHGAAQPITK